MKYKVGDEVKIRSWDSMEQEFGLDEYNNINIHPIFMFPRRRYCERVVTIKKINYNSYTISYETEDHDFWSDDMIDHVTTKKIQRIIARLELLKNMSLKTKNFENITGRNREAFLNVIDGHIKIIKSANPDFCKKTADFYNRMFRKIKIA